jgi:Tfp pilus assembly pilus retraction ATPase PilT
MNNPYSNVEPSNGLNDKNSLIELLGELESIQSFDDVYISSGRIVSIKSDGVLFWIGSNEISHMNVCALANEIGKGQNVSNDVIGGHQKDGRFQMTYEEKLLFRYRVNIVSRRSGESSGLRISLRSIKDEIPDLDYVSVHQEMFVKMVPRQGLVLLVGETGSGKTTTLASIIAHMVKTCYGSGFIATYEQPVEYDLENVVTKLLASGQPCFHEIHQHEIGIDLPSFKEAIRNALRSNPDIIILGELRESETIDAALQLALSGHLVFATVHAGGVVETVSKLVSAFDSGSRDLVRKDFAQAIRGIVCQKLLPKIGGGRVLCREQAFFNESFKRLVQKSEAEEVMGLIEKRLSTEGVTFGTSATRLFNEDKITKLELLRILGD